VPNFLIPVCASAAKIDCSFPLTTFWVGLGPNCFSSLEAFMTHIEFFDYSNNSSWLLLGILGVRVKGVAEKIKCSYNYCLEPGYLYNF